MTDRLIPRMPADSGIAGRLSSRLLDLADQVRRLDPPAQQDPERFREAKTEIAGQLAALAWDAQERLGADDAAMPRGGRVQWAVQYSRQFGRPNPWAV